MDQTQIVTENKESQASGEVKEAKRGVSRWSAIAALVGFVMTLMVWGLFFFHPMGAAALAVVSLVLSVSGLWEGRGCLRDLAIASVIASVVLIVVFALFNWGVPYAVDRL